MHQAHAGGGAGLGTVLREADEEPCRPQRLPRVLEDRVQRGEHALLAGLRGAQDRVQQAHHRREGQDDLRGLHLHPLTQGGEPGLAGAGGDQPQDAGAVLAHLRRRPAADLHPDAQRLLPPLPELCHLQIPAPQPLPLLLRVLKAAGTQRRGRAGRGGALGASSPPLPAPAPLFSFLPMNQQPGCWVTLQDCPQGWCHPGQHRRLALTTEPLPRAGGCPEPGSPCTPFSKRSL